MAEQFVGATPRRALGRGPQTSRLGIVQELRNRLGIRRHPRLIALPGWALSRVGSGSARQC